MKKSDTPIALVTGATRGIGRAVARRLVDEGVVVVGLGRRRTAASLALARELRTIQPGSKIYYVDLSRRVIAERQLAKMVIKVPKISILVNNAGILRDRTFLKMSRGEWGEVLKVNLEAVMQVTRAVLPGMVTAGYGRIVNMASVVGQRGGFGQTNYAAAKAGVIGLTKSLAMEVAKHGITVNAICPGLIETEILGRLTPEQMMAWKQRIALRRLGQPEEVAALVNFLVKKEAGYITGAVMNIDGGMS